MRATFLNNLYEAKLLACEGMLGDDDIVIPIGADARCYAESKKWNVRLIGSFISEEENSAGRQHCERIIKNVATAINEYYGRNPKFPPISLGDCFLFDLHILIGQVLFTNQLIESVSNKYSIRVFENQCIVNKSILGIRPHPDSLIAEIVRRSGKKDSSVVPYRDGSVLGQLTFKRRLRNIMSDSLVDSIYKLKWNKGKVRRPALWLNNKKKILVLGGMFDWKPVVFSSQFMAKFLPIFRSKGNYPTEACSNYLIETLSLLISDTVFLGNPKVFGFSRLAQHIHSTSEYLIKQCGRLERLAMQCDAVITSVFVTPIQHVIAHYAIKNRKPVICYQHGEMNLYPETFSGGFTEIVNATHYFAYGEGAVPKYKSFIGNTRLKEVVVVGSTRKRGGHNKGNLVVYATGKWFKSARPYNKVSDPDARLYEAQRDIIAFLEKYAKRNPSDRVIVKANNTDHFNRIPFHTTVEVDYTSRFADLLKNAKIVILDSPATTCIEAASTSVPLFVLSGRSPWYEEPMKMLIKRAIVEDRVSCLLEKLELFEKDGLYRSDIENRELTNAYAGECGKDSVLENVMNNLVRIIAEKGA